MHLLYQRPKAIQYRAVQYLLDTTVSKFTRDTLINAHDAYITVELLLHMRDIACTLQVLLFIKALKECSE